MAKHGKEAGNNYNEKAFRFITKKIAEISLADK